MAQERKRSRVDPDSREEHEGIGGGGVPLEDGNEGDEEPSVRLGQKAMLNPVVLARLFELCPTRDLRRFRLVCKLWHDLTLPRWKLDMKILFFQDEYPGLKRTRLNMDTICQLYETPSIVQVPYINFALDKWKFEPSMVPILEGRRRSRRRVAEAKLSVEASSCLKMALFWSNCAQWIRHLELRLMSVSCAQSFNKVLFEMTPNLETFSFHGYFLNDVALPLSPSCHNQVVNVNRNFKSLKGLLAPKSKMPFSWRQVFLHFPNLESLDLGGRCTDDHLEEIADNLEEASSRSEGKLNLKNVCFTHRGDDPISLSTLKRIFTVAKLELEGLDLTTQADHTGSTMISEVIKRHCNTLKRIWISRSCGRGEELATAPYSMFPFIKNLNNLTGLIIHSSLTDNLNFLLHTPNLSFLYIMRVSDERSDLEFGRGRMITDETLGKLRGLVLPHLRRFILDGYNFVSANSENIGYKFPSAHIQLFGKCTPNLRQLAASVDAQGFRMICQVWKELKSLHIKCNDLDNQSLTGIRKGIVDTRLPNITDLKYLNLFRLFRDMKRRELLSDDAIFHGFLQLSSLAHLHVKFSSKTSTKAYRALNERFPAFDVPRPKSKNSSKKQKQLDQEYEIGKQRLEIDYGI